MSGTEREGQPLGTEPAGSSNLSPCSAKAWLSRADLGLWETESLDLPSMGQLAAAPRTRINSFDLCLCSLGPRGQQMTSPSDRHQKKHPGELRVLQTLPESCDWELLGAE